MAATARAWVYVVLFIFVGVFLGVIVYNLATVTQTFNQPPINGAQIDIIPTDPWIPVPIIPPMGPMMVRAKTAADSTTPPFTTFGITYGVTSERKPWIRSGYVLADVTNSPLVVLANSADTYSFTFSVNGQWWLFNATNVNSLDWGSELSIIDEPPLSDTNCYHQIVIERTLDLQQWEPVFTNLACPANLAMIFIDTNAPFAGAFYRTVDLTSP